MEWTAVAVAVRKEEDRCRMEQLLDYLQNCGLFNKDAEMIVVVDASEESGSAGSALNTLLITTEHLCARRGYSVLNDNVITESKILLILAGETSTAYPMSRGFSFYSDRLFIETKDQVLPHFPIITQILNLHRIIPKDEFGLWILSSEALWEIDDDLKPIQDLSLNSLSAFCSPIDSVTASRHGTYTVDQEGFVVSLSYRTPAMEGPEEKLLILGLLYMPVSIASLFLSLSSTYPLLRATYHGLDSGVIGLKLSLFFDIVNATCMDIDEFEHNRMGGEKIDHSDLLPIARRAIHSVFSKIATKAVTLDLKSFDYLETSSILKSHMIWNKDEAIESMGFYNSESFENAVFKEFDRLISGSDSKNVVPYLRTLLAAHSDSTLSRILECFRASYTDYSMNLSLLSEALWIHSRGRGGIRCGPAGNEDFTRHFALLESPETERQGYEEIVSTVFVWLTTAHTMNRAARHLEAAAQIFTRRRVMHACQKHLITNIPKSTDVRLPRAVNVSLPARIDLYGGWLDTPPITLDTFSGVLNMAVLIDEERPLSCEIRVIDECGVVIGEEDGRELRLSEEEVWERHNKPLMQGSLVCACLVACGIIDQSTVNYRNLMSSINGRGLYIKLSSSLAHGSGMGSSSILAASCIAAIWEIFGVEQDLHRLVHIVLYVEQLLTTGGGWQDQVGGVFPGMKLSTFSKSMETIIVNPISIDPTLEKSINDRLIIVYTGQPRLAKNLLQDVVRSWLTKDGDKSLISISSLRFSRVEMSDQVRNWEQWIKPDEAPLSHIAQYYAVKKRLATGCEPESVTRIIECLSPISSECWLVGAGGGGYLCVWIDEGFTPDHARDILDKANMSNLHVQRVTLCHETFKINRDY